MRARDYHRGRQAKSERMSAVKSRCGSSVLPTRCTSHAGFKTTACGEALTGAAGGREAASFLRSSAPCLWNKFLGRIRLDTRQFMRKGEEALIYFPLQKKSLFNWVRGEIRLKVY